MLPWIPLRVDRVKIWAQQPTSEISGAFISNEISNNEQPIDLLIVGPCTVWWHLDPQIIQATYNNNAIYPKRFVMFGFTHAGYDAIYFLLQETLAKKKISAVMLPLPKQSDGDQFPHTEANRWWVDAYDFFNMSPFSLRSAAKIYGSLLWGFPGKLRIALTSSPAASKKEIQQLGFGRQFEDTPQTLQVVPDLQNLFETKMSIQIPSLPDLGLKPAATKSLAQIIDLLRLHKVKLIWVDSSHQSDLRSEYAGTSGGWQSLEPDAIVISPKPSFWHAMNQQTLTSAWEGDRFSQQTVQSFSKAVGNILKGILP